MYLGVRRAPLNPEWHGHYYFSQLRCLESFRMLVARDAAPSRRLRDKPMPTIASRPLRSDSDGVLSVGVSHLWEHIEP